MERDELWRADCGRSSGYVASSEVGPSFSDITAVNELRRHLAELADDGSTATRADVGRLVEDDARGVSADSNFFLSVLNAEPFVPDSLMSLPGDAMPVENETDRLAPLGPSALREFEPATNSITTGESPPAMNAIVTGESPLATNGDFAHCNTSGPKSLLVQKLDYYGTPGLFERSMTDEKHLLNEPETRSDREGDDDRCAGRSAASFRRIRRIALRQVFARRARHEPEFELSESSPAASASAAANAEQRQRGSSTESTTAMLRHIPCKCTRDMLVEQLNKHFKGQFDFVYLPFDIKHNCNVGYGFINFCSAEAYDRFVELFNGVDVGKCLPGLNSKKIVEVLPARNQGLDENITRLRNRQFITDLRSHPQMMPLIVDEDGNELEFPQPEAGNLRAISTTRRHSETAMNWHSYLHNTTSQQSQRKKR